MKRAMKRGIGIITVKRPKRIRRGVQTINTAARVIDGGRTNQ